ncbi:MAG TPA: hypothetical protein VFQ38_24775 [Longimicrobiales bacterium]|nr:hypothetical protein [Longimicrobiales bacterium]
MHKHPWVMAAITCMLAACRGGEHPPEPSFTPLFPPVEAELLTQSSPALADLDHDGAPDIVFGTGKDRVKPGRGRYVFTPDIPVPGYVLAVSGATNRILWKVPHPGEAYTTPRFADLNRDGVPDVVMGGREGAFVAYSGVDGKTIWRLDPARLAKTSFPYNVFTPALIRDANGDGVPDLVAAYGGNDTKLPKQPRDPAFLVVVSGADGAVLAEHQTPDGKETYCSPVAYRRPDGAEWVIFGTGGETDGGAAYRAPVASLLDGTFEKRVERLVPPGATRGVIAPATVVELTGDADPDIVISAFDGRLITLDGATGKALWERKVDGEEAYHGAAVVRIARGGRLGLFVSRGIGAFPRYVGSAHRLYDAADGRLLYEYKDPNYPAGAPLAVDLTGDGIDEPFFFSMRFPSAQGARIHILYLPTRRLIAHDVPNNLASTPVIADPRGTGTLELSAPSWSLAQTSEAPDWHDLKSELLRLDLSAKTPAFRAWAGYMGTAADGQYRLPTSAGAQR